MFCVMVVSVFVVAFGFAVVVVFVAVSCCAALCYIASHHAERCCFVLLRFGLLCFTILFGLFWVGVGLVWFGLTQNKTKNKMI